ncbi:hypothetical protein ACB092_11G153700 [Castanea dentata]
MEMSTISSESSYEKELECKEIIIQNPQWRPECCIYKVPKRLREVKKEAYTPRLISVGPLHRNIDASNEMEMLKQKYFQEFFRRTWKDRMEFENIISKKMILLDSIFIIELFLRTATRQEYEKDDYILSKPWLDEGIKHDLILLENQLPFFILDELHHHIGRYFYLPRNLETGNSIEHLHSATKLDTAGLKFQVCKENQADKVLLDIQVEKPNLSEIFPRFNCSWLLHCLPCLKCFWCLDCLQTRLVVPRFVINHGTEDLFRNLMALEQCHYPFEAYICNYILVEKKIIAHSLGCYKAVAQMVNKLGQEIVEKNSCYHDVAKDLNEHYGNWWNKNIASLRTVYFRDVWRGTATFVGIVVLFVTIGNFLRPFVFHK